MRLTPQDSEILRHAVVEILVARYPVPVSKAGIGRQAKVAVGFVIPDEDLTSALALGKSKGKLEMNYDGDGSTEWWTATAEAVLKIERAQSRPPRD